MPVSSNISKKCITGKISIKGFKFLGGACYYIKTSHCYLRALFWNFCLENVADLPETEDCVYNQNISFVFIILKLVRYYYRPVCSSLTLIKVSGSRLIFLELHRYKGEACISLILNSESSGRFPNEGFVLIDDPCQATVKYVQVDGLVLEESE